LPPERRGRPDQKVHGVVYVGDLCRHPLSLHDEPGCGRLAVRDMFQPASAHPFISTPATTNDVLPNEVQNKGGQGWQTRWSGWPTCAKSFLRANRARRRNDCPGSPKRRGFADSVLQKYRENVRWDPPAPGRSNAPPPLHAPGSNTVSAQTDGRR